MICAAPETRPVMMRLEAMSRRARLAKGWVEVGRERLTTQCVREVRRPEEVAALAEGGRRMWRLVWEVRSMERDWEKDGLRIGEGEGRFSSAL